MGEWISWALIIGIGVLVVCVYLLSLQLERSLHLAVSVLVGNQHKILERLDELALQHAPRGSAAAGATPVERRIAQRRRASAATEQGRGGERRRSPGRRREDLAYTPA